MANNQNQQEDVADYSGYFNKGGAQAPAQQHQSNQAPASPLQELPAVKQFTKRAMIMLVILSILIGVQIFLMIRGNQDAHPNLPEGYELVTPSNQPAYIQPIK